MVGIPDCRAHIPLYFYILPDQNQSEDSTEDLVFIHLCKLCCLIGCDACVYNFLDISVHNLVQLVQCQVDSVVRNTSLWEVVGSNLLRAISSTDL